MKMTINIILALVAFLILQGCQSSEFSKSSAKDETVGKPRMDEYCSMLVPDIKKLSGLGLNEIISGITHSVSGLQLNQIENFAECLDQKLTMTCSNKESCQITERESL